MNETNAVEDLRVVGQKEYEPAEFVYLISGLKSLHKIGFSNDPAGRARNLSSRKSGLSCAVVHQIATQDARWLERVVQAAFATSRVGGEWFDLTNTDIASFCAMTEVNESSDLPSSFLPFTESRYTTKPAEASYREQDGRTPPVQFRFDAVTLAMIDEVVATLTGVTGKKATRADAVRYAIMVADKAPLAVQRLVAAEVMANRRR